MLENVMGTSIRIKLKFRPQILSTDNQATGYASQHHSMAGGGAAERAFGIKMGDDGGGGTDSSDRVAFRWIVGASASVIVLCTIQCRRWRALVEEVDILQ